MKILLLNALQEQQVRAMIQDAANKLIEIDFSKPEDDAATIRRHAYWSGRLHVLGEILRDDFPAEELPETNESQAS